MDIIILFVSNILCEQKSFQKIQPAPQVTSSLGRHPSVVVSSSMQQQRQVPNQTRSNSKKMVVRTHSSHGYKHNEKSNAKHRPTKDRSCLSSRNPPASPVNAEATFLGTRHGHHEDINGSSVSVPRSHKSRRPKKNLPVLNIEDIPQDHSATFPKKISRHDKSSSPTKNQSSWSLAVDQSGFRHHSPQQQYLKPPSVQNARPNVSPGTTARPFLPPPPSPCNASNASLTPVSTPMEMEEGMVGIRRPVHDSIVRFAKTAPMNRPITMAQVDVDNVKVKLRMEVNE